MNQQEEMRIAIAEACGWSDIKQGQYDGSPFGRHKTHQLLPLPDYCNDLNAMHEAEKTLNREQRLDYYNELFRLLPDDENLGPIFDGGADIMIPSSFSTIHATAAQRAEAFLRCIGKWRWE